MRLSPSEPGESSPGGAETEKLSRGGGPDGTGALLRRVQLSVIDGPDRGREFTLTVPRTGVGSHPSNAVTLGDRAVSRFHCEILLDGEGVRVRDLGSSNGTLLDGVSIVEAHVSDGGVLALGGSRLRLTRTGERDVVALSDRESFGGLVGRSVAMRSTFLILERAAVCDSTVLLGGETGTGKEAAAEAIHLEGPRSERPFVVVDCGAVPAELIESELFGHERGAFTGAVGARPGAFESADGGTIFLDEIGELPTDLQPKLLRALEQRQVKRVGATRHREVDVRVIAATNRDLREEVNQGRFRPDLYFRLAVIEIRMPPLRELRDDLPQLIEHLLARLGALHRPEAAALLSADFVARIARHPWPGNVRELRNHLERCLALGRDAPLPAGAAAGAPARGGAGEEISLNLPLREARDEFERRYAQALLAQHGDNVSAAARAAGMDRIAFYRLLWRRGLK